MSEPTQEQPERQRVVVITPDGMGTADAPPAGTGPDRGASSERSDNPADLVEQPAKVMRIRSA